MIVGKNAENGKYSITQKRRNQVTVLLKNAENSFYPIFANMFITKTKIYIKPYINSNNLYIFKNLSALTDNLKGDKFL